MKRVVTIQDISCVGKCSLTVALPIISAMGVETAVIPTAVLSTHTAFQGFTFHDLTDTIASTAAHWKQENFTFDAIYTGYLGSFEQMRLVSRFFEEFGRRDNLIIVDPAMADHGQLYPGFTPEFAHEMFRLAGKADFILPNLTEAAFMLGIPYRADYSEDEIKEILKRLTEPGTAHAILTGVSLRAGELGAMSYSRESGKYFYYAGEHLPVSYHGTGDIFASTVAGGLARGMGLERSVTLAVDYTTECLRQTLKDPDARWYGVNFESAIPYLVRELEH